MKERPILYNGEMVRAILDRRKTQTRQPMKVQPPEGVTDTWQCVSTTGNKSKIGKIHWAKYDKNMVPIYEGGEWFRCPYGIVGDRLWVRERMRVIGRGPVTRRAEQIRVCYEADGKSSKLLQYPERLKWEPVIGQCLPYGGYREASRIKLEIENIRVERIKDISPSDVIKEGMKPAREWGYDTESAYLIKDDFVILWNSTYEKRGFGWDANPWVWVVEFKVL